MHLFLFILADIPFCSTERLETSHVYIASENYPGAMPGTDQDCSCEITATEGSLMVVKITAEKVHLHGNENDPCRERLSIDAGRSYQICPEKTIGESRYQFISNGQVLHPHLRVDSSSTLVIHLKTNSTTSTQDTGKLLLSVSSYGMCTVVLHVLCYQNNKTV